MSALLYTNDLEFDKASSREKSGQKESGKGLQEDQADSDVLEEYEGECEECAREVRQKVCPICED